MPKDFLKDAYNKFLLVCPDENCPIIVVVNAEKQKYKQVGHQEEDYEAWIEELIFEFEVAAREYVDIAY